MLPEQAKYTVSISNSPDLYVLLLEVSEFWVSIHKVQKSHNTEEMVIRRDMCIDGIMEIMEISLTVISEQEVAIKAVNN